MELTITEPQRLELRRALSERKDTLEKLREKNDEMGLIQGARDADTHIRIIAGGPGAEKGLLDLLATVEELEQQGMFDDAPLAGHEEEEGPEDERQPLAGDVRGKIVAFVKSTLPEDFHEQVDVLLEDTKASGEPMDEGEAILLVMGDEWQHAIEHNEGKGNLFEHVEDDPDNDGQELVYAVRLRGSPFPALWWEEATEILEADPTLAENALLDVIQEAAALEPDELSAMLSLVMEEVPPTEAIAQWPWQDRARAEEWAAAVHLNASDNTEVQVPDRPDDLLDPPYGVQEEGAETEAGPDQEKAEDDGKVTSIEDARKKAQENGGRPLAHFEQITPTLLSILQREGITTAEILRDRRGDAVKLNGVGPKSVAAIDEVIDLAAAQAQEGEGEES